ncbi:hypothetical protein AAAV92_07355 [Selenomonas noxia]|uniref:hypothetical protein n=1 Tax=Selenomonas noxia TaxID=135083 RepID=UPI0032BF7367
MINWNNVPSTAVDVIAAQEDRKLMNQMERELPRTCRDIIAWVNSKNGKFKTPQEERSMMLQKKAAEMLLAERGLKA